MSEDVTTEIDLSSGVGVVVLRRPPNNFLDFSLIDELCNAMSELSVNEQCNVIVLRSEGKNFCAGRDFTSARKPGDTSEAIYRRAGDLAALSTPWIACVQGAAVGAGLGLALLADFRVASRKASFWGNFVQHGLHPGFGLSFTLPRVVGRQRAALMLGSAKRVFAEDAAAWGLVDVLVDEDDLGERPLAFAADLAAVPPAALASTRITTRGPDFHQLFSAATAYESAEQARLLSERATSVGI